MEFPSSVRIPSLIGWRFRPSDNEFAGYYLLAKLLVVLSRMVGLSMILTCSANKKLGNYGVCFEAITTVMTIPMISTSSQRGKKPQPIENVSTASSAWACGKVKIPAPRFTTPKALMLSGWRNSLTTRTSSHKSREWKLDNIWELPCGFTSSQH